MQLRVWLFGTFQVEQRNEDGQWKTIEKSKWEKQYTRPFFTRLLCSRGRRAQRGPLLDDLWPDPKRPDLIERYLSDAYYQLRTLLRPVEVVKSLDKGKAYELLDQSLLWCDADACQDLLQEAERIGRTSAEALLLLEQAQDYFTRGTFLESESGQWAHSRRGTMERLFHRCSLWLAEAYEQQGRIGQAEMVYSRLLEENPVDEDVLCRLLAVLYKQGMTSQMQQCYQQAKHHFQQEGLELLASTKALVKRLLNESRRIELYIPHEVPEPLIFDEKRQFFFASSAKNPSGFQELEQLSQRITSLDTDEETLTYFTNLAEICWHLSKGKDLNTARHVLEAYLPRVATLALPPSKQQHQIAGIAASGFLLGASLAGHHNDLQKRQYFSEQALVFGNIAQERNLQVAALRQLAATFDYQDLPYKVLDTYQHMLPYLHEVTPLLRARIYAGAAGIYAQLGYKQEALHFLSLAYENFPDQPEKDVSFLFADCGRFTRVLRDGLAHLELREPRGAERAFAQIDGLQPEIQLPERVRAEILHHQVATFTALERMEEACSYLEAAVSAALLYEESETLSRSV